MHKIQRPQQHHHHCHRPRPRPCQRSERPTAPRDRSHLSSPEQAPSRGTSQHMAGLADSFGEPQNDQQLANRVNQYLDQAADQGAGKATGPDGKPNPGLRGQGELLVQLSQKYDIPIELMMAQLQKESGFLSDPNNLSIANNNPGNLRYADWESQEPFNGKPDGPGNFTTFPSIEQGLTAYAALLRNVYGDYIDRGDWQGMVNKYAPPTENDSNLYARQLQDWQADWRKKLGL